MLALATACTPQDYIRWAFQGTGQEARAIAIADRETGGTFDCAADNPRSSAAGLFQTLKRYHEDRALRLGFTWDDVAGPNCLADVVLAVDLWREQGWQPWSTG